MDFIRRWLAQIRVQLANLTLSQKLLIGTLALMVPMVLWLVAQYAGSPQLVPVLDQSIDAVKRSQIIAYLEGHQIAFDTSGDRILVPVERRNQVLASLQESRLLPEDTSKGFDALVEKQSWLQSNEQNRQLYDIARQNVLAQVIREFPGVKQATVLISKPQQIGFGATAHRPSASVNVVLATGQLDQKRVDAIAGLVSGAVAEMLPGDVTVIDAVAGRQWKVRDTESMTSGDYLELINNQERYYRDKISSALSYIRNVIVAVNVEVDMTQRKTDSTSFDRDKSVELLTRERNNSTKESDAASGGEPGPRANTGATIAGSGAAPGRSSSSEETETSFEPHAAKVHEIAAIPGGTPSRISATVNIPRSFFVALHRKAKPDDKQEPTDEAIKALVAEHLDRVQKQVMPLIKTKDPGTVVVDVYPDGAEAGGAAAGDPAAAGVGASMLVGGYAKPIGLGALALVSVSMMMLMVRKAAQRPMTPSIEELAGVPPQVPTEDELIGEAEASEPTLQGMELDEQTLRHKKLTEQVTEMIKANPNDVSGLVNRWVRKEE
jgi:flagellar biosynthesis/type III secretory pathway M-ring protein FliF/YscJ